MMWTNGEYEDVAPLGEAVDSELETSPAEPDVLAEITAQWMDSLLDAIGLTGNPLGEALTWMVLLISFALVIHFVLRHIVVRIVHVLVQRSPTWWDNVMVEHKVIVRLIPIAPLIVLHRGVEFTPHLHEDLVRLVQRVLAATIIIFVLRSLSAILAGVNAIYNRYPIARNRPIKGYLQVVMIVAYIFAGVYIIAILMDREPWLFLSGLGAMTAVILLIFRDTLLSLVAGVQLTANDLIRVGDWIDMPQFHADGDVVDVALNYVKVQNWDRTITVIPAHKFLEHSFKNWRSMFEGGGRRIMRAIHLDTSTIRFLREDEIKRFNRFLLLREYVEGKMKELDEYNREHCPEDFADVTANARHLTNVGTFRAYVINYLKRHPGINHDLLMLVRQLEPTPQGLPLQMYAFTNDTRWVHYEGIQADIFDHILAVVPEFGLRVFQEPSGADLARFGLSGADDAPVHRSQDGAERIKDA